MYLKTPRFGFQNWITNRKYRELIIYYQKQICQNEPFSDFNYLNEGIVFNDGPSWKAHRVFIQQEFRKFGCTRQSIESPIQLVADELVQQIKVYPLFLSASMLKLHVTINCTNCNRKLRAKCMIHIWILPRLRTTSYGTSSAATSSSGTIFS